MLWLKLKAGALQLTLFIAVVVALLLTAFILLVHTHRQFQIQTDFSNETVKNANKGVTYALLNATRLEDSTKVELEDEDYKSLNVYRDYWGVFEKIVSVSKIKNNRVKKCALIGGRFEKGGRPALYVKDNNKPLVLVGDTRIEGSVYLPKQGVKSGTISGHSYYGTQLIYGASRTGFKFPEINKEINAQFIALEETLSKIPEDQFLNWQPGITYSNSFFQPIQILYSNEDIFLSEVNLIGHIVVQSKSKITITASALLSDVILVAPEIEIKDNVKGNFQAIAAEHIEVGEHVTLDYPSALIVNEKTAFEPIVEGVQDIKSLVIGSNTVIKGIVLFLGQPKPNNYESQVKIETNAIVEGEVYCNQNIELEGTVRGTVYANNFIAKQFGSIYQNHIYNGRMLSNDFPDQYSGLSVNSNSKKGVVKWLY